MSKKKQEAETQLEEQNEAPNRSEAEPTSEDEQPSCEEVQKEPTLEEQIEVLKTDFAKLQDERLRDQADFENMKKRLEKEKYQAIEYANEKFARDMLSVIDALDMALGIESEDGDKAALYDKIKEGIDMTMGNCKKAFEAHGITQIEASGEFDPQIHQAMAQVEDESKKSGEIAQVFQKGYKIGNKVLRPSMVSIVK